MGPRLSEDGGRVHTLNHFFAFASRSIGFMARGPRIPFYSTQACLRVCRHAQWPKHTH
jgi:hypothetical protein